MLDEQSVYMGGGSEGRQLVVDFPLTESFSFYTKKKCWHCFIDYFPTHAAIQSSCCKRARSSVVRAWLVFAAMLGAGSCSVPLAASEIFATKILFCLTHSVQLETRACYDPWFLFNSSIQTSHATHTGTFRGGCHPPPRRRVLLHHVQQR